MKTFQSLLIALTLLTLVKTGESPILINIKSDNPTVEISQNFEKSSNYFKIQLDDESILENNKFYLVFESKNKDFMISLLKSGGVKSRSNVVMDLVTTSGNLLMAMSDTFFNGHLKYFKEEGSLSFTVNNRSNSGPFDYKIKVLVQQQAELTGGRSYTTRVDYKLNDIQCLISYDGSKIEGLQKIRFQITTIKYDKDFNLYSTLTGPSGNTYILNNVFKNLVGGVLSEPKLKVCKNQNCDYTLKITLKNIKSINIETFLIGETEELSFDHFGQYYDRVYEDGTTTYYKIPYSPSTENLDYTISIVPVTASNNLYINAVTKPLKLEKYDWKEIGSLAKRITIRWDELEEMDASKDDLYVAVFNSKSGEYLLKIEAHEREIRGKLHHGVIESGFIKAKEFNNYLYMFEVFKDQEIDFSLKMNIISGDADLYIKKCTTFSGCKFDESNINDDGVLKIESKNSIKEINHKFECKYDHAYHGNFCNFAIGILGKENHGTHYDITLHENKFHRLMSPNHGFNVELNPNETNYLKFSLPGNTGSKLYFSIESIYGNFNVYLDKAEEFPSEEKNSLKESFYSSKNGLYNSLRTLELNPSKFKESHKSGVYYITVNALTSCSLKLRYYEKNDSDILIHTLKAGHQIRGSLSNYKDIRYYTIKASLEIDQANSVSVNITPVKGSFILFASRNGKIPTKDDNDLFSTNNTIELTYDDYSNHEEHIIGVELTSDYRDVLEEEFQYFISITYSNKPLKLNPGILSTHTIKENNHYLIDVTADMAELLILKSIVDGHNISLCAKFNDNKNCLKSADERYISIFFKEEELKENCKGVDKCTILLEVNANKGQIFSIGFTYNDHPFKLTKEKIFHGPAIMKLDHKINFVYHTEKNQPVGLYFNSKGSDLEIYTKLISSEELKKNMLVVFPTRNDHDESNRIVKGYSTNIFYNEHAINKFDDHVEILISVRPSVNISSKSEKIFDGLRSFIIQAGLNGTEILRTQVHSQYLQEEEWIYFYFYNNGPKPVNIYVTSDITSVLTVMIAKNKQSRPPFNTSYLVKKTGVGNVDILLDKNNVKGDNEYKDNKELIGFFTVGIKSSSSSLMDIYWTNTEKFDYIELTPSHPSKISLKDNKDLYFNFYAKELGDNIKDRGIIRIYVQTNVRADIFILRSLNADISKPSKTNNKWKTSLGKKGGITVIEIHPSDADYCLDCNYIGFVETVEDGTISLLGDVEHDNIPIYLTTGFTFPEILREHQSRLFRIYNEDDDEINLSLSLLSGFVEIYIGKDENVNEKNKVISYNLADTMEKYMYIKIKPSSFNITRDHDYFIYVKNTRSEPCAFNISVIKNTLKSKIEPGIRKNFRLGIQESAEYFYDLKEDEKKFEAQLEVKWVGGNEKKKQEVLDKLKEYLNVFLYKDNDNRVLMKKTIVSVDQNRIYVELETNEVVGVISIHVFNPVGVEVELNLDLNIGGYKLLNLNDYNLDKTEKEDYNIYEIYGHKGAFLFVDLRMCYGDVKVSFYESDYNKINEKDHSKYKTIKDSHSLVHYLKLGHERLFVKVQNSKRVDLSLFNLSIFNERNLDNNPYSEISQGNLGKVSIETDSGSISFDPLHIKSTYSENFNHQIIYTVYLSEDIKLMKYAKNCGKYMYEKAFPEGNILKYEKILKFKNIEEIKTYESKRIEIFLPNLLSSKKYYGIVISTINLMSNDKGDVKPIKSGKAYYDEFIYVTPKFNLPFKSLVGIVISLGIFIIMFYLIKDYVFGRLGEYENFQKLSDLRRVEDGVLGFNAVSVLEHEYYEAKKENVVKTKVEIEEDVKDDHDFELTEDDHTTPLDLDMA